jgi:hypothetical protein
MTAQGRLSRLLRRRVNFRPRWACRSSNAVAAALGEYEAVIDVRSAGRILRCKVPWHFLDLQQFQGHVPNRRPS